MAACARTSESRRAANGYSAVERNHGGGGSVVSISAGRELQEWQGCNLAAKDGWQDSDRDRLQGVLLLSKNSTKVLYVSLRAM